MIQITRCPNCQTRFKVKADQLAAHGGKVRCGRCSFIFDARDHFELSEPIEGSVSQEQDRAFQHNTGGHSASTHTAPPPPAAPIEPMMPFGNPFGDIERASPQKSPTASPKSSSPREKTPTPPPPPEQEEMLDFSFDSGGNLKPSSPAASKKNQKKQEEEDFSLAFPGDPPTEASFKPAASSRPQVSNQIDQMENNPFDAPTSEEVAGHPRTIGEPSIADWVDISDIPSSEPPSLIDELSPEDFTLDLPENPEALLEPIPDLEAQLLMDLPPATAPLPDISLAALPTTVPPPREVKPSAAPALARLQQHTQKSPEPPAPEYDKPFRVPDLHFEEDKVSLGRTTSGQQDAKAAPLSETDLPASGAEFVALLDKKLKETHTPPPVKPFRAVVGEEDEEELDSVVSLSSQKVGRVEPQFSTHTDPLLAELTRPVGNLQEDMAQATQKPAFSERIPAWAWGLGIGVLASTFAVQSLYLARGWMATQMPSLRPSMMNACKSLGCDIPLPKNSQKLKTMWSELTWLPDQPNRVLLSAGLKNLANHPQALPQLELRLTDTQEQLLSRKVFQPKDYLPPQALTPEGILAGQEVSIHIQLQLMGIKPAGYQLYWFY